MARPSIVFLAILASLIVCVAASRHGHHYDYYTKPKYHFKYGVDDHKHGDHHSQWEERDGDKVKGGYSVKEADGTWRHVTYTSDKETGFNAVVERRGHAVHESRGGHGDLGGFGHLKEDFIVAKSDRPSHESLENYPDGTYGYVV